MAVILADIKSNQFYLSSPKSQSHCLNGLYKKKKKTMEETSEPQRRDPSSRTDRPAIDVASTERGNKSQFTSYINRKSDKNYM